MSHNHDYAGPTAGGQHQKRLTVVLVITGAVMVAEAISGGWCKRRIPSTMTYRPTAKHQFLNDALGSAAVIVAAIIVATTGWTRADAIVSLLIGALILPRTWILLRDSGSVLLEATPDGLDLDAVR